MTLQVMHACCVNPAAVHISAAALPLVGVVLRCTCQPVWAEHLSLLDFNMAGIGTLAVCYVRQILWCAHVVLCACMVGRTVQMGSIF